MSNKKKKVLVVIDMQEDFVNGPLGTPEARAIIPAVREKIQAYLMDGDVVYTKDTHVELDVTSIESGRVPKHCIRDTNGWDIVDEVFSRNHSGILEKNTFALLDWDEERNEKVIPYAVLEAEEFELVGVCTDICVASNALILRSIYPDRPIKVDASCCAGTTQENHLAALRVMRSCLIDIINAPENL